MKDFFVSYNSADRHWAEWIAWHLEESGYTTVIQAWDSRPGKNFVLWMQESASQANRTIAVLSPAYLDAAFTQPEWTAAFRQDPTGEKGTLLPVRVETCDLKGLLPAITYIDLVDLNENWPQAFAENFDAVFGKKHRSWKCFFRSCLASTLASVIVIFIWVGMRPDEFFSVWHNEDFMTQLILFPVLLALLNFLPDYLSLLETRYIIKRMTKTISLKIRLSLLLFDVILTGGIALSIVPAFLTLTGSEPLGTSFLIILKKSYL